MRSDRIANWLLLYAVSWAFAALCTRNGYDWLALSFLLAPYVARTIAHWKSWRSP